MRMERLSPLVHFAAFIPKKLVRRFRRAWRHTIVTPLVRAGAVDKVSAPKRTTVRFSYLNACLLTNASNPDRLAAPKG
jgi:hypothetical protein